MHAPIDVTSAHVLFDTWATHSFVSSGFVGRLDRILRRTPTSFVLSGPSGQVYSVSQIVCGFLVRIKDRELEVNQLILPMIEFDVILGMYWLSVHGAFIDCQEKKVLFAVSEDHVVEFRGISESGMNLISSLRADKLISQGCAAFLALVVAESSRKLR